MKRNHSCGPLHSYLCLFRLLSLRLALPSLRYPADQYSTRNVWSEFRHNYFSRMSLYAPLRAIKKLCNCDFGDFAARSFQHRLRYHPGLSRH